MENIYQEPLPELVFGSSDSKISRLISKLEQEGKLRKLSPRLYSGNLADSPEEIVKRNLFAILGKLYPGAVLSHRSALEFQPTATGQIFLTYSYTRKASLPGVTVRLLKGYGPDEGDNLISEGLYVSQKERALLENLQISRKPGPDSKTLTYPEIEERLEQIVRVHGEEALNLARDRARSIAMEIGLAREFYKLDKIVSALLTTHPSKILQSPVAAARAFGVPYDPDRHDLFRRLFQELKQFEFKYLEDQNKGKMTFRHFAFYESYFSNYIEGTRFEVGQARQIVASQIPMPTRDADSHDVLGTYQIVSSRKEMKLIPETPDELIAILKSRHETLLSARTDKAPGQFKEINNYAGQTEFVDAKLVKGTLIKSFDFYAALKHPFARAAYIMFVVSEVHPFLDGNGRLARVMMNAELVNQDQARIIIPTAYREDYILTLRKLTRRREPQAYVRMLSKIHNYSASIVGDSLDEMQQHLEKSGAFFEPNEGKLKF